MPRIFISYRRTDSAEITEKIYRRFVARLGHDNVFKDVNSIPIGENFRAVIESEVLKRDIMLVIIGPTWLSVTDAQGKRRLDDPDDAVRTEVELGLRHIKVCPVLVNGARMPSETELPVRLAPLSLINAPTVNEGADFEGDVRRLVDEIAPRPIRRWIAVLALLVILAVSAAFAAASAGLFGHSTPTQAALLPTMTFTTTASNVPTPTVVPTTAPVKVNTLSPASTETPDLIAAPRPTGTLTPMLLPTEINTLSPTLPATVISTLTNMVIPETITPTLQPSQCVLTNATNGVTKNIRNEPNLDATVIATLPTGGSIAVVAHTNDDWNLVSIQRQQGWIMGSLPSTSPCNQLIIVTDTDVANLISTCSLINTANSTIAVRSEPTSTGSIIRLLQRGEIVFPTGYTMTGWFQINTQEGPGWIGSAAALYSDPCRSATVLPS